jgi:Zn-dependent M16 (insulinase) family peptidase
MERVESVLKAVAGTPVQWDDQPTNGIVYVNMVYDTAELPAHLRPYLPLFCSLLTSLGTADMDFQQLAEAIKSSTGGVSYVARDSRSPGHSLAWGRGGSLSADESELSGLTALYICTQGANLDVHHQGRLERAHAGAGHR